ncbi:rab-GTPase-TBC domain-containing protein [Mycena floridula]|nr:rab-GTPase-TBC domain-containing protein [Mycena floridula]
MPQLQGRGSEDSPVLGREASFDLKNTFLRTESPAFSTMSSNGQRSPVASESGSWPTKPAKNSDSESSIDAHRQRELKWVSLMSTVPAAQARKNKKVKKLLLDGVPSSVRYLVWSHVMDGKARNVPGVYSQLGQRGKVAAFADIERDVRRCFADHPQFVTTQGSLLSLLQAYLTMVPDIQYSTGLTLIAGHLLLLAPEEDAFWIFVSMMDTYLRSYFSINTTQLEVDSALFAKALEVNDAQVAKKILLDMSISPGKICHPWFSTLFVGTLPTEYLHRVWDIFLYEGSPFLFRVGLALIYCCRRTILEATSEEAVLICLRRVPLNRLPPSPEAFINLALSVKVKDDDVRKQRVKMEAQIKRQTQVPRMGSNSISLPRG